jgi:hypothetical protein
MRRLRLQRLVVVSVAGLLFSLMNMPAALAQPANDDFDTPTVIAALPFTDSINTVDATAAADDPSCTSNEHSVWYSFTPSQDTPIRADTAGSDYNTALGVYTGSRGALGEVACEFSGGQVAFNASANTTYFFMIAGAFGGPGGNLVFRVNPPPANDDFDSPTVAPALPFTDSVFTGGATTAADDPSCAGNEHSVWYSFTPTRDMPIRADTAGSDYTTSLGVYTGPRGGLSEVACASSPARVIFSATANTTYFFMVAGVAGGTLVFNVTEGPPANDEIGGATPLTLNTPITQDTTFATSAPTDPTDCTFGPTHNTVWFSFTPAVSQPLNLDRSGSNYEGTLTLLTDLGSGPVVIACGFRFEAGLRFDATAGRTYFFMDSGSFEGGGQLQLTLRPGIVMTVVADQTGTVSRSGTAVVSGTLACNPGVGPPPGGMSPTLHVDLRQRISKTLVIEGSEDLFIPCPLTPTAWSATIIGDNGPFRKGRAEVFVRGRACDAVGCAIPEVRQPVRLNWE